MGPGCPVCVTDAARGRRGRRPGAAGSARRHLRRHAARARARRCRWPTRRPRARASTSSTAWPRRSSSRALATRRSSSSPRGFETTAVATAAVLLAGRRPNFSVLSAHKYIPPVMEIVAEMPGTRVEGFLAAGHAATITGWGVFEPFVERHRSAGRRRRLRAARHPRRPWCSLRRAGARRYAAGGQLPFRAASRARAIARAGAALAGLPAARRALARHRARAQRQPASARRVGARRCAAAFPHRHRVAVRTRRRRRWPASASAATSWPASPRPTDCPLFGAQCLPDTPVGACMVSSEGTCRIWHQYGGHPDLRADA